MKNVLVALALVLLVGVESPILAKSHRNKPVRVKEAPYISVEDGIQIYHFAFINASTEVSMCDFESMVHANVKNSMENYAPYWFRAIDAKVYGPEGLDIPENFSGKRVPFIVTDVSGIGLGDHANNAPPGSPEETEGYLGINVLFQNFSIQTILGITTPPVYPYLPWGYASIPDLQTRLNNLRAANNPYVPSDVNEFLSFVISHEIAETLGDDCQQNYSFIDNFAAAASSWYYAVLDEEGNVTNAIGTNPVGTLILPTLNSSFPDGWLMMMIQENADVVSWSIAITYNGYYVDGWLMTNFPLPSFWKGYYLAPDGKYDFLGHVNLPLNPVGGLHEPFYGTLFTDLSTGTQYVAGVLNHGPVTAAQEGYPPNLDVNVNVEPFTTYVVLYGPVNDFNPL
jgi:hypothetical protein